MERASEDQGALGCHATIVKIGATMKCIVCNNALVFYFDKVFDCYGLSTVHYWRCPACGFVMSRTHCEMSHKDWSHLNLKFHEDVAIMKHNPQNRPPPYLQQALMLHVSRVADLLSDGAWLDWAAGEAQLSTILLRYFGRRLLNYDKYRQSSLHPVRKEELRKQQFMLVVNSAMFEHVRTRQTLDRATCCPRRLPCDTYSSTRRNST